MKRYQPKPVGLCGASLSRLLLATNIAFITNKLPIESDLSVSSVISRYRTKKSLWKDIKSRIVLKNFNHNKK